MNTDRKHMGMMKDIIFQFFRVTNNAPMVLTLPVGKEGSVLLIPQHHGIDPGLLKTILAAPVLHYAS